MPRPCAKAIRSGISYPVVLRQRHDIELDAQARALRRLDPGQNARQIAAARQPAEHLRPQRVA
jgi:hypothetical protein